MDRQLTIRIKVTFTDLVAIPFKSQFSLLKLVNVSLNLLSLITSLVQPSPLCNIFKKMIGKSDRTSDSLKS